ncbi:MAG TPA: hypothetical protein VLX61_12005 [Anaerolineales bacterium]|nr:hypothetical protein [Anaerolineales bacterium]
MKKMLCVAAMLVVLMACSPVPPNPPPAPVTPTPTVPANLIATAQQWVGNPNPHQACGQMTEQYLHPVCGVFGSTTPPPDSDCIAMAEAYADQEAYTVSYQQICQTPKTCQINHVLLGQPDYRFEDLPPGECPGQTAGWSCRIQITYDNVCKDRP